MSISTPTIPGTFSRPPLPTIPPLHPGDHLTAEEFERRFEAMPDLKKAELIEGVVFMPSPVSIDDHGSPHADLITWLGTYRAYTPGVQAGDNATTRMDSKNRPQPDGLLRILPEYGGQSSNSGKYVGGAPEWTGEIVATSAGYDLHEKLETYQRNGVQEYVVWRVWDRAVDWFNLKEGKLERQQTSDGIFRSTVFPGLWLDAEALVRGDMVRVLQVLQHGIATPEHDDFVKRLALNKA
jgi:hypothetical protein